MTPLSLLVLLCAGLALAHARRRREHWPVASLVAGALVADVARWALDRWAMAVPRPYEGVARWAWYVEQGLEHAWPAGLAAVACWVFLRRRPWTFFAAWAAATGALCARYPDLRGEALAVVKAKVWTGFLAAGAGCAVLNRYLVRDAWQAEHVAVGVLLAGEAAAVWAALAQGGAREAPWWPARLAYSLGFALLALYEARRLRRLRRS